ncbi:hypothetical protein F5Y12DRAFT_798542 [Xylaria sp. FL1777]|nr:hypothetical protein F5Y12DRAFT_798542 [Xylaria sp. FL1777]
MAERRNESNEPPDGNLSIILASNSPFPRPYNHQWPENKHQNLGLNLIRPPRSTLSFDSPILTPLGTGSSIASGSKHTLLQQKLSNHTGAISQKISLTYQGNHVAARNQSADIPAELSTSVWITNLPPICTYADLLGRLTNTGKVCATVISAPQGNHTTSAAKVVFFDVEGKNRLLARASEGQFTVGSFLPYVMPNRYLTAARPAGPQSRVLLITGPTALVSQDFLCKRFRDLCAFELEYVREVQRGDGVVTMEWAFGSYRCQAERVYDTIQRYRLHNVPHVLARVQVRWGRDPCDRQ